MQIINDAYAVLGDPAARAKYDAKLAAEDAAESKRAQSESQAEKRRQEEIERQRQASEAARRQREAQEAERKRQSDEAVRQRQAAEEAELKRRTEAEKVRRDKAKRKSGYVVTAFVIGMVLLGLYSAVLNGLMLHAKSDEREQIQADVLDRPELVSWVKSVRDARYRREMFYAPELIKRDGTNIDVWLMQKYDEPVTDGGEPGYTYGIESARIDCAMNTIANGSGAVYDQTWKKLANFNAGNTLPLLKHPPDVQATAEYLCTH